MEEWSFIFAKERASPLASSVVIAAKVLGRVGILDAVLPSAVVRCARDVVGWEKLVGLVRGPRGSSLSASLCSCTGREEEAAKWVDLMFFVSLEASLGRTVDTRCRGL